MYVEGMGYMITCPYCFHEFQQEHTVFRAHTAFDRAQLETDMDDDMGGLLGRATAKKGKGANDPRELFLKYDPEGGKKQDTKLMDFWAERGGSSGYSSDEEWNYPHIDPQSPEFFDMICTEPRGADMPGNDGFVRHADGFIKYVLDKYSSSPKPMTRLCPSCHNPLPPLADYGKYPVKFISVVGVTRAGKTVFLNQLLTRFSAEMNLAVTTNGLGAIGESIGPRMPLPAATDDKVMRRPLAVTLKPEPGGVGEYMTLVFYDIAGENCVNEKGDPNLARAKSTIGNYIAHSDGMIFLLDPEQIPSFARGNLHHSNLANVTSVLSDIRQQNNESTDWDDVPVAICLAKSDKLDGNPDILRDCPVIFSHATRGVKDFEKDEIGSIDTFLRTFLEEKASNVVAPLSAFRRRAYFALSAITCGVESRFEKYQNQYILDDENEAKFHYLHQWIEGWNARTIENRAFYNPCKTRTVDGMPIVIPPEESITFENADSIVTEIRADSEQGRSINLTLWDVAYAVNLVGYPISDPAPRRIADPMKWILWKLGDIGPYYMPPALPKKKALESTRKYEQRKEAYYQECLRQMKLFYGDPVE